VARATEIEQLRAEDKQRQAELAIVNEIIHSLAQQRDFGQIVEAVGERAAAALAVRGMSISTVDPVTGELTFHFWIDEGVRNYDLEGIKLGDPVSAEILRTNRAVRIGTAQEAAARGTPFKIAGTESYLGVPIPTGERAIGVFALGTHEKHAYSESDERLVGTMAMAIGVALDNARLAARTRQRVTELAIVNEVNQAVGAQLGPDAVIELVGDRVSETFHADITYVGLLDKTGAGEKIVFPYYSENGHRKSAASIGSGDGWTSRILKTGQSILVNTEAERDANQTHHPGTPPKSYLGVPIRVGDESIGVLAVQNARDEGAFDDADQGLLSTIAAGVGVAIQNAELYAETRRLLAETNQRVVELEIVNEVGRALASQLEFGAIVEAVGDRTASALGVRGLSISIVDPATDELTFYYWIDDGVRRSTMERIVLGDSLSAEILRTNRAVRIGSADDAAARGTPFKIGGTESYVGVPIPAGGKAIGVFAIGTHDRDAYTESEERILATLAATMGVALQNARLVEETRQRAAELATINEVGQAVAAQLDLETLIELVGDKIGRTFTAADVVYVALHDPTDDRIEFPYYSEDRRRLSQPGLDFGQGLTSRILASREPLLVNRSEQFEEIGTRGVGREARSYLGVPIVVGDDAIGVISIQSSTDEGMFDEADRRLLSTLAANVGTAIQKARLFAEMEKAKEAAEAANEAKSTFLASVSHELRTPLTSVLGFAKVIRRQLEERILPNVDADDERTQRAISQVRDNVDVIVQEGERLTTLVNNVLDLAKIEAGRFEWNMQPLSMAEVADRAMSATASLFESTDLELRRDIPDDLPQIVADRDGLMQVIINLLSNAVKFTEEGSVTCRASVTDEGVVVSVTDTGIGIAPANQPRVFDKFTQVGDTLTDKPHGTGLGLPICREIVESHGGRIWVESEPGVGSTFSFVLPVAHAEVAA
jgi:signal transduction histidine kinase